MSDINKLVFSSMVFLTNVVVAFWYEYYLYSFFFLCLTMTSYWHHSHHTDYSYVFDKIAIFSIVLYGGYLFYEKTVQDNPSHRLLSLHDQPNPANPMLSAIIVATFLATLYLYYGGYCLNNYCFHEDKNKADWFHALMHIISSIGHHLIIIL
jgi:hypothetical protein